MILGLIRFYQKYLSFDSGVLSYLFPGGACRFSPTCSEYTYQAIKRYGTIRGTYLGVKRFLRCNGFSKGGFDEVPS